MFRPPLRAIFMSQSYLFEEIIQYVIKYINLKFNKISLLFIILMLFMTRLRFGYVFKTTIPSKDYDRPQTTRECGIF